MKILKKLQNKQALTMITGGLVVLGLAGGGVYLAQKKSDQMASGGDKQSTESAQQSEETNTGTDNPGTSESTQTPNNQSTQNNTTATTVSLDDVTIQGSFDENNNVTTRVYGSPGTYTVEKLVNGNWVVVVAGANYRGSEGLFLNEQIPSSELSRTYRVYKTVDGQKGGPKTITVETNLVRENGVESFSGSVEAN